MEAHDEELVKSLAPQNATLRRAYEKHTRLKGEVDALSARAHLTHEEELRRRELQKQKLAEKDKIVRLLEEHRRGQGQVSSGS
jgi:uncharacterized protein